MDHPVSWLAKVHRQTKPRRRGPVGQSVVSVGHLGRLTAADGFALRLSACPSAILSTEPGGISPQYVARIAMVGSHWPVHILPFEVGDLNKAVLDAQGVLA